jgi:signal transduction histidine kinase
VGLYLAERSVSEETQHDLQRAFASELELMRTVREIRHTTLSERCRVLVRKPRIHAALEDGALDLLYPSAKEELGDALPPGEAGLDGAGHRTVRPRFYRFLNVDGRVIPPVNTPEVGTLAPDEEQRLNFNSMPQEQHNGYLVRADGEAIEIIATPIVSTETGEAIAALVAGFPMAESDRPSAGLQNGIWLDQRLHFPELTPPARESLARDVSAVLAKGGAAAAAGIQVRVNGQEQMLFCELLNPGSLFPPAYEVGIYPLSELLGRQWELRRNSALGGALLLGLGMAASFYISARLAVPVRELAAVSAENRILREKAEAALEVKSAELERSARFSADASHQLQTPVAVLRAGLDELIARDDISGEIREELSLLVHQTFRLSSIIGDLLLLSRLDSGRLQLALGPVDIQRVVETGVDDLHLLYEDTAPEVDIDLPPGLSAIGDMRYTLLILQNLLENAHKYGRRGKPIRVTASEQSGRISLVVANAGDAIPESSREHIFERFHRASVGENIPGHGLGLNIARELARLHGGDLLLRKSDGKFTEFEVQLRSASTSITDSVE